MSDVHAHPGVLPAGRLEVEFCLVLVLANDGLGYLPPRADVGAGAADDRPLEAAARSGPPRRVPAT